LAEASQPAVRWRVEPGTQLGELELAADENAAGRSGG